MSTLLKVSDISVSYGNIRAIEKVNVEVSSGEIVCLIGANGAGKSTLLKAITGLEPILSGHIELDGKRIAEVDTERGGRKGIFSGRSRALTTNRIVELGVAMVPEGRRVFSEMTVRENLEMGAFLERGEGKVRRRIEEMYERFPILGNRERQKAGSLSGGEQQMLVIARALMSSPRLLLLDEPALGLAPLIIRDIFEIITRINRDEGVTIFLVEQNALMALGASQRGYVIETGSIVMVDTSENLLGNERVRAAYIGE